MHCSSVVALPQLDSEPPPSSRWGLFDVRTQLAAQREVAAGAGSKAGPLPPALRARNPINVVSCAFVLALYVLMVVKPDVPLPFRPHGFAQRI